MRRYGPSCVPWWETQSEEIVTKFPNHIFRFFIGASEVNFRNVDVGLDEVEFELELFLLLQFIESPVPFWNHGGESGFCLPKPLHAILLGFDQIDSLRRLSVFRADIILNGPAANP